MKFRLVIWIGWAVLVLGVVHYTTLSIQRWVEQLLKGLPPENAGSEQYIIDITEILDLDGTFYMEPRIRIEDREDWFSGGYPIRETAINMTASTSNRLAFFEQHMTIYTDSESAARQFRRFQGSYLFRDGPDWEEMTDNRLVGLRSQQHHVTCQTVLIHETATSNLRCSALLQTDNRLWYVNSWIVREDQEYLTQAQFVTAVLAADALLQEDLVRPMAGS